MRSATMYFFSSLLMLALGEVIALPAPLAPQQSQSSRSDTSVPYAVPDEEVPAHETGDHKAVRLPVGEHPRIFQSVRLKLIVDIEGQVISASPEEGPRESYSHAIAEAMSWKYLPFEKDGAPTVASITDYVRILPLEDLPKTHQDFPDSSNLAGLVMTLSRTGCFGACPSYTVEIHGDGTILYKGNSSVVFTGDHRDQISAEQVSEVLDAFHKADYFSLRDEYSYQVTDCPTYTTSFQIDQVFKSVTDYVGAEAGMPQSVSNLEETIDRVSGTMKWIKGNAETVPALKREGWDFKSPEAAEVLARASQQGSSALVRDLLAQGIGLSGANESGKSALAAAAYARDRESIDLLIKAGAGGDDKQMKTEALAAAAQTGNPELVRVLLDYGGDAKGAVQDENGTATVLMSAVLSGVPEIVEMILAAQPNLNARDEKGRTALWYLSEANTYWDEKRHADRPRVVHILARAGANLNSQDDEGNAPLHGAYSPDVVRALIQDGANVDIRNAEGDTPLMTASSLDVMKLLVAAGADTHARNHEGKTALDIALDLEPNGETAGYLRSLSSAEATQR
jgi:ankyrin repeat protein